MPTTRRDQLEAIERLRMKLASYLSDLPEHARSAQHAGDLARDLIQLRHRLSVALERVRQEDSTQVILIARELEALYVRDAEELAALESRADLVTWLTQLWLEAVERAEAGVPTDSAEEHEFVGAGLRSAPRRWRDL